MRISDWSSDVCSSDLAFDAIAPGTLLALATALVLALSTAVSASVLGPGARSRQRQHDDGEQVQPGQTDDHGRRNSGKLWLVVIWRDNDSRKGARSEEHTSELQYLMRISYAVLCLKKKKKNTR